MWLCIVLKLLYYDISSFHIYVFSYQTLYGEVFFFVVFFLKLINFNFHLWTYRYNFSFAPTNMKHDK